MAIPAIPAHLQLQIVSADRSLVNEQVDEVRDPGRRRLLRRPAGTHAAAGDAAGGELWYRQGQEKHYLAIAFGFAEVQPDRVTILAMIAEKADEIDLAARRGGKKARRGASGQADAPTWISSARGSRC